MLITQACKSLNAVCEAKQSTQLEMQRLAAMLPEYEVVMQMEGAGPVTGPALMAEIGDVRRFKNKKALVAFAGIDAPPFQSGAFESKSRHVSKRGSPHLRRTIFIISNIILTRSNPENAVYCFMDKSVPKENIITFIPSQEVRSSCGSITLVLLNFYGPSHLMMPIDDF